MPHSFLIDVYDKQQCVYNETFTGIVELGRQRDGKESLFFACSDGPKVRVAIARLDEDTVSRDHARIESLPDQRTRITNISTKVSIRLADGSELKAGTSTETGLPVIIYLGRKAVRIQSPTTIQSPSRVDLDEIHSIPAVVPQEDDASRFLHLLTGLISPLVEAAHADIPFQEFARRVLQALSQSMCFEGIFFLRSGNEWRIIGSTVDGCPLVMKPEGWRRLRRAQCVKEILFDFACYWRPPPPPCAFRSPNSDELAIPLCDSQAKVIGALHCERGAGWPPSPELSVSSLKAILGMLARIVTARLKTLAAPDLAALAAQGKLCEELEEQVGFRKGFDDEAVIPGAPMEREGEDAAKKPAAHEGTAQVTRCDIANSGERIKDQVTGPPPRPTDDEPGKRTSKE